MSTYVYQCQLSANGQMYTSTYFVEGETEDAAYHKGDERLYKEWEGVDFLPVKTTLEEVLDNNPGMIK